MLILNELEYHVPEIYFGNITMFCCDASLCFVDALIVNMHSHSQLC
jgi:hypothetical protein